MSDRRRPAPSLLRRIPAVLVSIVVVTAALAGCGIPEDDVPRVLGPVLPTPSPTPTPAPATTQQFDVYLIQNNQLSPVSREVPVDLRVNDLIDQLAALPSEAESEQGLTSAVPNLTTLVATPPPIGDDGVATIDLNAGSLDTLGGDELRLALAQIVWTFTESGSIDGVVIQIEGESRPWPTSEGDVEGVLTRDAYRTFAPGFVEPTPEPTPTPPPEQQGGGGGRGGRGNGGGEGGEGGG